MQTRYSPQIILNGDLFFIFILCTPVLIFHTVNDKSDVYPKFFPPILNEYWNPVLSFSSPFFSKLLTFSPLSKLYMTGLLNLYTIIIKLLSGVKANPSTLNAVYLYLKQYKLFVSQTKTTSFAPRAMQAKYLLSGDKDGEV